MIRIEIDARVLALIASALCATLACDEMPPTPGPSSARPRTTIEFVGNDHVVATFRWSAYDPDGTIAYYEWAAFDEPPDRRDLDDATAPTWNETSEHGLTLPTEEIDDGRDTRTFAVRAADDEGHRSVPAMATFEGDWRGPSTRILRPIAESTLNGVPTPVRFQWASTPVDAGTPVIGYQMKLIACDGYEEYATILAWLLDARADGTSTLRRPNLLIPDSLRVAEPRPGHEFPELPSEAHFFETDWWPHLSEPWPATEIVFDELDEGYRALAVRAVDRDGRITPSDGFRLASGSPSDGANVVYVHVNPTLTPAPRIRLFLDEVRVAETRPAHSDFTPPTTWPESIPLPVRWDVSADWYGYAAGESRYRIDGPRCPGTWSRWSTRTGIDFTIPRGSAGDVLTVRVQARDARDSERVQNELALDVEVLAFTLTRAALWIDDYVSEDIDDCQHDALIGGFLEDAIAPHLERNERLDRLDSRATDGACGELDPPREITLADLRDYRLLYWDVGAREGRSALGELTRGRFGVPSLSLHHYVRAGGNLVIWGRTTIGALMGDVYRTSDAWIPAIPPWENPNFGPGSFVWDMMRIRDRIDRSPRGTVTSLLLPCSGIVGLEASESARRLGMPAGRADPTGYAARTALWSDAWGGYHNPAGTHVVAVQRLPIPLEPGVEVLYTMIANEWAWPEDPREVCLTPFGSRLDDEPVVLGITTQGGGRIVWIGTELWPFARAYPEDVRALLASLTDWALRR